MKMADNNFVNISAVSMCRPARMADVCHALMNISGSGREKREREKGALHAREGFGVAFQKQHTNRLSVCL